MTPKDARDNYYYYTGKVSDVVRQLGLAAIGLVWVFKADLAGKPVVPSQLLVAAQWAVASLSLDFAHYLYGSAAWGILHGLKERKGSQQYTAPRPLNWLTLLFFWGKSAAMVIAYAQILSYLSRIIRAGV